MQEDSEETQELTVSSEEKGVYELFAEDIAEMNMSLPPDKVPIVREADVRMINPGTGDDPKTIQVGAQPTPMRNAWSRRLG